MLTLKQVESELEPYWNKGDVKIYDAKDTAVINIGDNYALILETEMGKPYNSIAMPLINIELYDKWYNLFTRTPNEKQTPTGFVHEKPSVIECLMATISINIDYTKIVDQIKARIEENPFNVFMICNNTLFNTPYSLFLDAIAKMHCDTIKNPKLKLSQDDKNNRLVLVSGMMSQLKTLRQSVTKKRMHAAIADKLESIMKYTSISEYFSNTSIDSRRIQISNSSGDLFNDVSWRYSAFLLDIFRDVFRVSDSSDIFDTFGNSKLNDMLILHLDTYFYDTFFTSNFKYGIPESLKLLREMALPHFNKNFKSVASIVDFLKLKYKVV